MLLLLIVTVVLPVKRKPAVLFVPVPVFPLIPTPTPAVVFVNRATVVELGTLPADQLPVVSQAPLPAVDVQVFVVCACTCGAASNASAARSNRSIRKSGDLVFMGMSGRSWQLAVGRKRKLAVCSWRLAGERSRQWSVNSWQGLEFGGRMLKTARCVPKIAVRRN